MNKQIEQMLEEAELVSNLANDMVLVAVATALFPGKVKEAKERLAKNPLRHILKSLTPAPAKDEGEGLFDASASKASIKELFTGLSLVLENGVNALTKKAEEKFGKPLSQPEVKGHCTGCSLCETPLQELTHGIEKPEVLLALIKKYKLPSFSKSGVTVAEFPVPKAMVAASKRTADMTMDQFVQYVSGCCELAAVGGPISGTGTIISVPTEQGAEPAPVAAPAPATGQTEQILEGIKSLADLISKHRPK